MIGHTLRKVHARVREWLKDKRRSPQWSALRDNYLGLHPSCEACGYDRDLQVHHVVPVHINPTLELVAANLITLCMGPNECHLRLGHGGGWKHSVASLRSLLLRLRAHDIGLEGAAVVARATRDHGSAA